MQKESEVLSSQRTDLMKVDFRSIIIENEFNHRGENNFGDIEALALNIVANGVLDPLLGHKVRGEDRFVLTEGNRRLRAVKMAFKNNADGKIGFEDLSKIKLIPMRMVSSGRKDRLLIQASTGFGKVPLTDLEKSGLYKELIELSISEGKKRGEAIKELVVRLGISQASVYNTLKLNELDEDIKGFIASGEISGSTINQIIREEKDMGKVKDLILSAVYDAENKTTATGSKKKATAANVKGLKQQSPLQRLQELATELEVQKVNNERSRVLFELIEELGKKSSLKRLIEIFV